MTDHFVCPSTSTTAETGSRVNPYKMSTDFSSSVLPGDTIYLLPNFDGNNGFREGLELFFNGDETNKVLITTAPGESDVAEINSGNRHIAGTLIEDKYVLDNTEFGDYYLFFNGRLLKRASDQNLTDGEYFTTSASIWYKDSYGHPASSFVVSCGYLIGFELDNNQHIHFDRISLKYCFDGFYGKNGCSDITITNTKINHMGFRACIFEKGGSNILIHDNEINHAIDAVYFNATEGQHQNHEVYNNKISYINYHDDYDYIYTTDGHGVGCQRCSNSKFYSNEMRYVRRPIHFYTDSDTYPTVNNIINANIITDNRKDMSHAGIEFQCLNTLIDPCYNNRVIQNYIARTRSAFKIRSIDSPSGYNYFLSNTVDSCYYGSHYSDGANRTVQKNNIYQGCDIVHEWMHANLPGTDHFVDFNYYYPDGPNKFFYRSWTSSDDFADWKLDSGLDEHSLIVDSELLADGKSPIDFQGINAGIMHEAYSDGCVDPWGKYLYRIPNIGADQESVFSPGCSSGVLNIDSGLLF